VIRRILGILGLAVAVGLGAGPAWGQSLPLEGLLDRHAAVHGHSRHEAHPRALHLLARVTAFGLEGTLEVWTEPPLRITTRLDLGPVVLENGFDGDDAWIRDRNGGVRDAVAAERAGLLLDALIGSGAYVLEDPPLPLHRRARRGADGSPELIVGPVDSEGQILVLDPQTYALRRSHWRGATGPEQTHYGDFRRVEGVLLPHRLRMQVGGSMELDARVVSYRFTEPRGAVAYARPAAEIPLRLAGRSSAPLPMRGLGAHIRLAGRVGSREGEFLLDSGAGGNVLDQSVVEALGLETLGEVEAMGVAGRVTARFVAPEAVAVGGVDLPDQSWMSLDFGPVGDALGGDLIGVLGYDTFRQLVVEIDYQGRWVRFHDPTRYRPPPEAMAVPIRLDANIPSARVALNGEEAWVHLDTGSDNTLDLTRPFLSAAGLAATLPSLGRSGLIGVGGHGDAERVRLDDLELGGYGFEALEALVHEDGSGVASSDVAGVLGAGVLSRFHCVFDYSRSTLWLTPNRAYQPPVPGNPAGARVRLRRGNLVVTGVREGSPAATAGLRVGDRVVGMNNRSVRPDDLSSLEDALDGDGTRRLKLRVLRDGQSLHRHLLLPSS